MSPSTKTLLVTVLRHLHGIVDACDKWVQTQDDEKNQKTAA